MEPMTITDAQPPESSVYQRYAAAAHAVEPALCCPVQYSTELLDVIPQEIIERDYGCGDPTPFIRSGETVLDLGSGGGKLCYIAAQVVGREGRVIGVDCNAEMLGLARKHAPAVADKLGFANVDFRYGLIQDLGLDLDQLAAELSERPIHDPVGYLSLRHVEERLRRQQPLIADDSIDCVLSNCVLNLVRQQDRRQLFAEIFRVLRRGGRAAISDIVSDENVPERLQQDPDLWSGCITGAFREDEFLKAFEAAGFHGIEIVKRQSEPWRTVEGIEFRSVTVVAYKGKHGPCWERGQAVSYRGPFRKVEDDDGHTYYRGERMAVCDKTFNLLQQSPYAEMFDAIEPREMISLETAKPFDCKRHARRHPRETKGLEYDATTDAGHGCSDDGPCC
ncbi:methyltransferase domain-containing protein [Allorhodopirellula heiligendammensis]|uniref:Arsenite methyltransferase n=1 Tax=Allorhodopirellula heiligendammensis TaxID=2714739 RepID=A0A5C6BGX6_9BACT|nr:methyltransferase domain-containing protein [Allorhodopirellula heiligendammensis]TWU10546.1 arsenite S-adenosylmethyltransferase [Allorhodopirellula heiligendammensis]